MIARAILKDAPILIIDEGTSSLDLVGEEIIQQALESVMQDKTTIIIAHRLSTLLSMDKLIILNDNGTIIEGTHTELLHKSPIYRNMWNIQTSRQH